MQPRSLVRLLANTEPPRLGKIVARVIAIMLASSASILLGQFVARDPGVRGGSIDAGQPLASLLQTPGATDFFNNGLQRFATVDVVQGGTNNGLGPRFNSNQCASCHIQPSVGGSSPSPSAFPSLGPNPQMQFASASNTLPSFITPDGPVREARFKFFLNGDGSLSNAPDGGVHDL